jgi:hypothetical protein
VVTKCSAPRLGETRADQSSAVTSKCMYRGICVESSDCEVLEVAIAASQALPNWLRRVRGNELNYIGNGVDFILFVVVPSSILCVFFSVFSNAST